MMLALTLVASSTAMVPTPPGRWARDVKQWTRPAVWAPPDVQPAVKEILGMKPAASDSHIAALKAEGEQVVAHRADIAEAMAAAHAVRIAALKAEGEQVVARRVEIAEAMTAAVEQVTFSEEVVTAAVMEEEEEVFTVAIMEEEQKAEVRASDFAKAQQRISTLEGGLWAESIKNRHLIRQLSETASEISTLSARVSAFDRMSPLSLLMFGLRRDLCHQSKTPGARLFRSISTACTRKTQPVRAHLRDVCVMAGISMRMYAGAVSYLAAASASTIISLQAKLYTRYFSTFPNDLVLLPNADSRHVPRGWKHDPKRWRSTSVMEQESASRLVLESDW